MVSKQPINQRFMHKHLTTNDRVVIARLHKSGHSQSAIAQIVNVHRSTINRELKRNTNKGVYRAAVAKNKTRQRRCDAKKSTRIIENSLTLECEIKKRIHLYHSPEQISGRLKRKGICISHTTIYAYLYRSYPRARVYLRHPKKRRLYGTKRAKQQQQEEKKVRIDQRASLIENRERLGDFEGDTMILGGRKQRLYTLVDRRSGYAMIRKLMPTRTHGLADLIYEKTKHLARRHSIHSITYDNGSEFSLHEMIKKTTGATVYFAYPYHSWERGTNENTNGLIRQFFPKKLHGDRVDACTISKVQHLLNHRPRKRLDYLTPYEVFVLNKDLLHLKV